MLTDTIHAEIEWWSPQRGADVLDDAIAAAAGTVVDGTVNILAGGEAIGGVDGESSVFFTAKVPAGGLHRFYNAVRNAGFRIRDVAVIPDELANADAVTVWNHLAETAQRDHAAAAA